MNKKKLFILIAASALLLSGCKGKDTKQDSSTPTSENPSSETQPSSSEGQPSSEDTTSDPGSTTSEEEPPVVIDHQSPFVRTVENPSQTRQYREEFDEMVEDFSSLTPTGTTTGEFNAPVLRVLVDSEDGGEPTSPDAAIYKMATGNYQIQDYEGIGFKIRAVGNKAIKNSNLVLGLRGDDAWKVYPIKLSEALDPDQEALPELTDQWQEIIVSPGQTLDGSTKYELAEGGASETGVLEKILGFHLYALGEECSAVIEIENVFLYNAGEKTVLDSFHRERVNKTDDTCWWRDSTGFIVQKGVTLKEGQTYTTKAIDAAGFENLVINVMGDTTGLTINDVAYANLKDASGAALTGAVNGAFMPYVVNFAESSLTPGTQLVFKSTTEVVISQVFFTNLQNEAVVTEYPYIDTFNASYATKFDFNIGAGTTKTNYDDAILDTRVTDAGLNYMISYKGTENISVEDGALKIAGGDYDYTNLVIGSNADSSHKYIVFAMKSDAKPSGFRFKLGGGGDHSWVNDWLAGAGLPSWSEEANYAYNLDNGFKLVIVDLARAGQAGGNNEVEMYYTGTADLYIDSIFFADDYEALGQIVEEQTAVNNSVINAGSEYQYVGYAYIPEGFNYAHVTTNATAANEVRFEGNDGAKWLKNGEIIDNKGNVVEEGTKDFIIDLVASGLKAADVEQGIHVHSTQAEEAANINIKAYKVLPAVEIHETEVRNKTVEAADSDAYVYVDGIDVPADVNYLHVVTTAAVENQLRLEGNDGAKWLKDGALIDKNGNVIPDGPGDYVVDLVASGLKAEGTAQAIHFHSTGNGAGWEFKAYFYSEEPVKHINETEVIHSTIAAGEGYAYVGGVSVPANIRYAHVQANATVANLIRYAGYDGDKWMNAGAIIGEDGNPVADGAEDYIIDLVASGLKEEGKPVDLHVHSNMAEASFTLCLFLREVLVDGSYAHLLSGYAG